MDLGKQDVAGFLFCGLQYYIVPVSLSQINWQTSWSRTLLEKLIVTQLVKKSPRPFMEPKYSLPCSQHFVTGLHLEPD